MSKARHPHVQRCHHGDECGGIYLDTASDSLHLDRGQADDLLRRLEIELHGEAMARTMGGD